MFDPIQNIYSIIESGFGYVGLILEVYFGPVLLLVVSPLVQIVEYFGAL